MRAQFNKVGAVSGFRLILHPDVLPAVTINVPQNQGTLRVSPQGSGVSDDQHRLVVRPRSTIWSNPPNATHLPVYLSNDVLVVQPAFLTRGYVIGYHGTRPRGSTAAATARQ